MPDAEKRKQLQELYYQLKKVTPGSDEDRKLQGQISHLQSQLGEACTEEGPASTSPEARPELVRHIQVEKDYFERVGRDVHTKHITTINNYYGVSPSPQRLISAHETSAYELWPLNEDKKWHLVRLLFACPCIREPLRRYILLRELPLPVAIRSIIKAAEFSPLHLFEVVNICLNHKGGLEWLNDQIQFVEFGSEAAYKLNELLQQICPKKSISWTRLTELKHLLFVSNKPRLPEPELNWILRACHPSPEHFSLAGKPDHIPVLVYLLDCLAKGDFWSTHRIPILDFVTTLLQKHCIDSPEPVENWLCEVSAELGLFQDKPESIELSEAEPYYLLIQLDPDVETKDQYLVQAWLFKGYGSPRVIYAENERFSTLHMMPDVLESMIKQVENDLAGEWPTIEFLVSLELLNHSFEEWEIEGCPIGADTPVVVRSLDRLRKNFPSTSRLSWHTAWKQHKKRLQHLSQSCLICMKTPEKKKKQKLYLNKGHICFSLQFVPESQFLTDLFLTGASIALWPRQVAQQDLAQELHDTLLSNSLQKLPALLKEMRMEIWAMNDHLGKLSLLWDDPDRQPPEFKREQSGIQQQTKKRFGAPTTLHAQKRRA